LAKKHLRIKRQRADFAHKVADNLVKNYGRIAVEDLRIKNMVRNHHLAHSISDAGWGQFLNILSYKAEYAGREFVQVNPNGTSQICSGCGATVKKSLSTRVHNCPACGLSLNRDFNAALNIKRLGLSLWDSTCDSGQCVSQEAVALQATE
jgi:putative transposase